MSAVSPFEITGVLRPKDFTEERKGLGITHQNKHKQSVLTVADGNVKISSKSRKRKSISISDENSVPVKHRRTDGIYEDLPHKHKKQKMQLSVAVQTEESQKDLDLSKNSDGTSSSASCESERIINMLTSDTAPPEYWEELAEKRREALEETLVENKKLTQENKCLKEEVAQLKEENKLLDEMVKEAKELAQLVEVITAESGTGSESE
ncbi:geminin-like isoform X1 [Macrobrachium rosenbergii]|uniref:geminin-like isoform X1 n=1 Tax=Macrobrachium rosenbergii TaxID=79674 RepID=UPI0034D3C5FF